MIYLNCHFFIFKGTIHLKWKFIIYLPSCCCKPIGLSCFHGTQKGEKSQWCANKINGKRIQKHHEVWYSPFYLCTSVFWIYADFGTDQNPTTLKFENQVSLIHERTMVCENLKSTIFFQIWPLLPSWTRHGGQWWISLFLANCNSHFFLFFIERIWTTSEDMKYSARAVWASFKVTFVVLFWSLWSLTAPCYTESSDIRFKTSGYKNKKFCFYAEENLWKDMRVSK